MQRSHTRVNESDSTSVAVDNILLVKFKQSMGPSTSRSERIEYDSTTHRFHRIVPATGVGTSSAPIIIVSEENGFVGDVALKVTFENRDPEHTLHHFSWQATDRLPTADYERWFDLLDEHGISVSPAIPIMALDRGPFEQSELVEIGRGASKTIYLLLSAFYDLRKPGKFTFSCFLSNLDNESTRPWKPAPYSFEVKVKPPLSEVATTEEPSLTTTVLSAVVDNLVVEVALQNNDSQLPLHHFYWQLRHGMSAVNYKQWFALHDANGKELRPVGSTRSASRSRFHKGELVEVEPAGRKSATLHLSDYFKLSAHPGKITFSFFVSDLTKMWRSAPMTFDVSES